MTAVPAPSGSADSAVAPGRESQEGTTMFGLVLDTGPPTQPSAPRGLGHIRGPGGRSLQEPGREADVEAAVGEAVMRGGGERGPAAQRPGSGLAATQASADCRGTCTRLAGEHCPPTATCGFEAVCYVALPWGLVTNTVPWARFIYGAPDCDLGGLQDFFPFRM